MSESNRAIVIGAGVAGLLAARSLSESHDRVLILDRDSLPQAAENRTGVPQALHLHGLLARGRDLLEELFPGLSEELVAMGAITADLQGDIRWTINGHAMSRGRAGLEGLSLSRALLEHRIRTRVSELPGVEIVDRCEATGPLAEDGRVAGVRAVDRADGNAVREWPAALVVDASGRGSRSAVWLAGLGYPAPEEERVRIGMAYATRRYRREPGQLLGSKGAVVTLTLDNPRGGAVASEEGDRWIVTLAGILGDDPPLDPEGYAAFAATLGDPRIHEVITTAEPLGDPVRARFPVSVRRRYDRLARFPEGYLVVGDALCSFNPVYSQGMTIAAEEALLLRACLAGGSAGLARGFYRRSGKILATPWSLATGGDLRFPAVQGRRSLSVRLGNRYLGPLSVAVGRDPAVARTLLRIANLLDPPARMFAPGTLLRVLRANRPGNGKTAESTDPAREERQTMTTEQPETCPYPFGLPEALDLHPQYAELREQPGMARVKMTYGQPAWLAVRYEDVRTVLGDQRFSRAGAVNDDEPRVLPFVQRSDSIFTTDAPDHTRLRRSVAGAFTARRVERLRPAIQAKIDELLDGLERKGPPADLVHDFSLPLSIMVICSLLGVPYESRDRFREQADIILVNSPDVGVDPEQIVGAQLALREILLEVINDRRANPAEDLISVLVHDDEGRLTEDEIIGLGVDVLIAGHETSTNFISNFVYTLITRGLWDELRDAPEKLPQAVEELLRITPMGANAFMARVATEDVELGGVTVRAGEAVLPAMAAGNRDGAVFDDPENVRFGEERSPHLTFGHGMHHCLGAQLGRLELRLAIAALLDRLPGLKLAVPATEVRWRTTMLVRGPWNLPVTW